MRRSECQRAPTASSFIARQRAAGVTPLAQEPIMRQLKQQVIDIVPARLRVTEHRLCVMRCAACGETTRGEFPQAVRSGVQYGSG